MLELSFSRDAVRSRKENAPQNLALLQKLALDMLRQHPGNGSIKANRGRATWDDTSLLDLITHMR